MQEDKARGPKLGLHSETLFQKEHKNKTKTESCCKSPSTPLLYSEKKLANILRSVWGTPHYAFRASTTVFITVVL